MQGFFDQTFFVGVSFLIFVYLAFKPAKAIILKALDDRTNKIKSELAEASRLKSEAEDLLNSYKNQQSQAKEEANKIVQHAKSEAVRIAGEAEKNLEENINRKIDLSMQKIANYETAVLNEIRNNAVTLTTSTVRQILLDNTDSTTSENDVNKSISDLRKNFN